MKTLKWIVGVLLWMGAVSLFADSCTFGVWYVGKAGVVTDWAGSLKEAERNSKEWTKEPNWQLNRGKRFSKTDDQFAICEVIADKRYKQGLTVPGHTVVRLNGEEFESGNRERVVSLDLKSGRNTLEMMVKKEEKRGRNVLLTLVTAEYVHPSNSTKIDALKRAVKVLDAAYPSYKKKRFSMELSRMKADRVSDEDLEEFQYRALVLENPEVDFDEILFRASKSTAFPANWKGNSGFLRAGGKEKTPSFTDEIRVFNLREKTSEEIYVPESPKEGLMDFCLDYDAKKFIYSGVDVEKNTFQLYEMNVDGSEKRQITTHIPEVDHYNGTYLPNGKVIFCSTASLQAVPCVSGNDYVGNLFDINLDGTDMRQITFDQENDWCPWVTDDGRVMFLRWEYTDNAHYFTRILMKMNPDGTNLRSMYGSNSFWPNTMFYAKQIPGKPSQFAAICSGHHGVSRAGELIVFDTAKGDFEADGVVQRIPGFEQPVDPVIVDNYMSGKYPRFLHPVPLNENYFLVSGQIAPGDKWAIYLVDRFDNMVKLHETDRHAFEPIPIRERVRPPVIPERRNPAAKNATLFIQDIYEGPGLKGVPRGTVKYLRLFTYGYAYRLHGGHDALAIEGGWDTKRVLGTVPVEEDGSVMVNVPHSLPLSIQPLDAEGRALQLMRSWLTPMPGERLSCVGCHEPPLTAPPARVASAARKAPQELTPWDPKYKPYGFGFEREIQPVLDRYCAGCHDGEKAKPNLADIEEIQLGGRVFGASYVALHPYVRRPGPESDMHLLPPLEYHASTSELMQMLEKGHHGVELDDDAYRRLYTWIDLNVPYHATWVEERSCSEETKILAENTVASKKTYAGLDDDPEWMPDEPIERPDFIKPRKPSAKPFPKKFSGWPLSDDEIMTLASETRTLSIGGTPITFAKIPAGRFVMGSMEGAIDEYPQTKIEIDKPFLMSIKEITNEEYSAFDEKHHSGFIDQQWKDHIFPGYAAHEPQMPVVRISWQEAMAYCQWASDQSGFSVTLPTEAQWEWAARAGSHLPFHFGDTGYETYANLADKSIGLLAVKGVDPQPVAEKSRTPLNDFVPRDESFDDGQLVPQGTGMYAANPWNLFDMHGNVSEWTRSDYVAYPYQADDGRNAGDVATKKVVRGGSWRDRPHRATASYRLPYESYQKVAGVGFRIVMEFDSEAELDAAFSSGTLVSE